MLNDAIKLTDSIQKLNELIEQKENELNELDQQLSKQKQELDYIKFKAHYQRWVDEVRLSANKISEQEEKETAQHLKNYYSWQANQNDE